MSKKQLVILTRNLVKAGQPLLCPIYKADGTLLAQKGIVLSQEQVSILSDYEELYTLGKELAAAISPSRFSTGSEDENVYKWRSPFNRLNELRNDLIRIIQAPMEEGNEQAIYTIIRRVQTICEEAPDAALASIVIDQQEHYAAQHSIHVAILCVLSAQYLGWDKERTHTLLAAALTMNISLGLMQNDFQSQPEPLTAQQQRIIAQHPEQSAQLLREMGITNKHWLHYVEMHHESIDGSGYPKGLLQDEIPVGASIIHLADVYCAKVTGRTYRSAMMPHVAVRTIFVGKGKRSKANTIEVLLKVVGLYPPGCQVLLENGETAVVIKRGNRVDAPHVRSILDAQGNRYKASILRNTNNKAFAIKDVIAPNVIKYDPEFPSLWGY